MSGEVPVSFTSIYSALPQVRAGKAKALAVTGAKRSAAVPELPTVSEAGLPGYESRNWYGFLATAGTPRATVEILNSSILKPCKTKKSSRACRGKAWIPMAARRMNSRALSNRKP